MSEVRIRCPKCAWEPDGLPYWQCHCGHVWDTFETAARCPMCKHQHKDTQCPDTGGGCSRTSPHLEWYEGLDRVVDAFLEEEAVPFWLRYQDAR